MTIADQRKRLAKLEARKKRAKISHDQATEMDVVRAVGFTLHCAVEGIGGIEMFERGRELAHIIAKAPQFSPEERALRAERNKRAGLKHGV